MNNVDVSMISFGIVPYVAVAIGGFLLLLMFTVWMRRAVRRWRFGKNDVIAKHWKDVQSLIDRGDCPSLRLALIQADSVLELALKAKAFPGATTGDKLKFASRKYRHLRQAFWARALRNRIVHEAGTECSIGELRRAVGELKKALETLGAL